MRLPPLDLGQRHLRMILPLTTRAEVMNGAPGTVRTLIDADGFDEGPVPTALVALTVKV